MTARAMGNAQAAIITQELLEKLRENVIIDWTIQGTVRAKLRVTVRRILMTYGYPPDLCEEATRTAMDQAKLLCADWVSHAPQMTSCAGCGHERRLGAGTSDQAQTCTE